MKEILATLTSKGQVTLPAEVRKSLGLKTGDKIAFRVEDNEVRLRRTGSVVETTSGILKSHKRPLTAEELRAAAEQAMAEEALERSR